MGLGRRLSRQDWSLFWLGDALINQKCLLIPGGPGIEFCPAG